jgi:hypothetical protein
MHDSKSQYCPKIFCLFLNTFFSFSYTVPKKEAMEFTREIALKTEHNALKTGILPVVNNSRARIL